MTVALAPRERADRVDLRDLECTVTVKRAMFGSPPDETWGETPNTVAQVSAEVVLRRYEDDDGEELDGEEESVIARAEAYAIDVDTDEPSLNFDVIDTFDEMGGEAFHVVETALSGHTIFDHLQDISEFVPETVTQLIIIESVEVDEAYRGQRIGPRLLTTLTDTVAGPGWQSLILLHAHPLHAEGLSPLDLRRARKKIAASYESVGYAHFRDGIYWRHTARIGPENLAE